MYQITLVNMPFASLCFPSIGLTQVKRVVDDEFQGRAQVDIKYINHEFGRFMGPLRYQSIANSAEHHNTGLGDWFFRQVAFPELKDNIDEYLERFYPDDDERAALFRRVIRDRRSRLSAFMDQIVEKYKLYQSDMVGFASMFSQTAASLAMTRRIKELNPGVIVVMGGANCESPMGQEIVRNYPHLDFVFSGSGLRSFPKFVGHCLESDLEACHRLNGVFSRSNLTAPIPAEELLSAHKTGLVTMVSLKTAATSSEGERPRVSAIGEDLDINRRIPLNYDQFLASFEAHFSEEWLQNNLLEPTLLFETSRGCWWGEKAHCTFCGLNGTTMAYRAMDPELAITHIKSLLEYSSRCKRFFCVDNIMPKSYIKEVFPHMDVPPDVTMFYEVKSDLTEEDIRVLSEARVLLIQPGIEALATSTLKLMKKGSSSFQNVMFLKNCVTYSIHPQWNLLIGFPGEGEEVYKKYLRDLPLLVHLTPPSGCFPVRFDRYSPYFVQAESYGLKLQPADYYKYIYPFPEETFLNMAYYFMDYTPAPKYRVEMFRFFDALREQAGKWREKWYKKSRPRRPQLFFKDKGEESVIFDSRTDDVLHHRIGRAGTLILDLLNKPRRISDLAAELRQLPETNVEEELAQLQGLGLIFQEGDRFLSLVLPGEPAGTQSTGPLPATH